MTNPQSLQGFCRQLRGDLRTMPALRRCYDDVPDSINESPSIIVYPVALVSSPDTHGTPETATLLTVYTVRIELRIARKDLEREMALVEAFADVLPPWVYRGFATDHYAYTMVVPGNPATANNATPALRGNVVESQYGADQHIGYQLDFDVAIRQEVPRE